MGFVVLATSGPKSANQCSIRGKSVPNNARKVRMGWRFSRGVTVQRACPAKCGKMPPTLPKPDSMYARRSDKHWEESSLVDCEFVYLMHYGMMENLEWNAEE